MNKDDAKIRLPDGRIAYDCAKLAAIPTEGVFLDDHPNHYIEVTTENTKYGFRTTGAYGGDAIGLAVRPDGSKPKYLAEPTQVNIHGSTWGGSMIKLGYLGVGMYLEMSIQGRTITTSEIQTIRVADLRERAAASKAA